MAGLSFLLNGSPIEVEVPEGADLLRVLRRFVGITSCKNGCDEGQCGACAVLLDGKLIKSCVFPASRVAGRRVTTVEGLSDREKEIYSRAFTEAGAVQCGFCTPGMVIGAKALLDRNPDPTEDEIRKALATNVCRCTGYVKIFEAVRRAARALRGEEPDRHLGRIEAFTPPVRVSGPDLGRVGAPLPRLDGPAKVLGTARFADDLSVDGMLYGAVLRPKYPRARVLAIDVLAARALDGSEAVLTAADIPGKRYQGHIFQDWPALVAVGEEVRYVGDALALVAARTPEIARAAVEAIRVEYEALPPVTGPREALADDAPRLHPKGNLLSESRVRRGDVQAARARCRHVVHNRYRVPFIEHAFLEPESALAAPEPEAAGPQTVEPEAAEGHGAKPPAAGGVTIYCGSQGVHHDRKQIAALLGLPLEKVRVVNQHVGGGFGGKEDLSAQHHAALLARATGKPVKLTWSRRESLLCHPKRHAMEIEMTTGCDEAGNLLFVQADILGDTGAYASLGAQVLERACAHAAGPYQVPNVDIRARAVYTNNPPAGAMRGFGVPQVAFACETQMDILAELCGISPWEIRYRNALQAGDRFATGQVMDQSADLRRTLEAVREVYEANPRAGIACAVKNVGLGVGAPDVGRARIEVRDGRAVVFCGAADIGQGLATVLTQIVCEQTGLSPDQVEVVLADTALTTDAGVTTASRQTVFSGEAVRRAAEGLARAMAPEGLARAMGGAGGLGRRSAPADLIRLEGEVFTGEFAPPTDPLASQKEDPVTHYAYGFATQVVLMDEVGRVAKVVAAHDVGRVINPVLLEGQVEGAIVMGLGYALREEFQVKDCVPATDSFRSLRLLKSTEIPEIELHFIERGVRGGDQGEDRGAAENGPPDRGLAASFGAKGIGEIACIPTAPAVAAARYRLTGKRCFELPLP